MNKKLIIIILIGNILRTGVNLFTYKLPRIDKDVGQKYEFTITLNLYKTKEKLRVADMRSEYLEQLLDSKTKKGKQK